MLRVQPRSVHMMMDEERIYIVNHKHGTKMRFEVMLATIDEVQYGDG
jgi:hypothetical protein